MSDDPERGIDGPPDLRPPGDDRLAEEPDGGHVPERRRFLRQLSGDAIVTAGKMAGLSALIGRSLSAASESVARDLEGLGGPVEEPVSGVPDPGPVAHGPDMDDAMVPTPRSAESEAAEPKSTESERIEPERAAPAPDPTTRLSDGQRAFLATRTVATLATNDPGGAPYLAVATLSWDGTSFRVPSQLFGSRAANIERDRRVSLHLTNPETAAWVVVTGEAVLVDPDPVADTVVVEIRPVRFVWGPPGHRWETEAPGR